MNAAMNAKIRRRARYLLALAVTVMASPLTATARGETPRGGETPRKLVGNWKNAAPGPAGPMHTVLTLQPNGEYAATTVSGNGAYRITSWGQWRLHGNYLRFYVKGYSPRRYLGRPVHYPRTWGESLRSVGDDQFVTTSGAVFHRQ